MTIALNSQSAVLIVSDAASEAALVKSLLDGDVDKVLVATSASVAAELFQQSQASVVVLAYRNLQEASQVYLGLYRSSTRQQIPIHPHRAIALCDRKDVKAAYELCSNALISDYVQFWPNSNDTHRLLMSVKRAMQECLDQAKSSQSATVLAQQAQRLTELEALRSEYMQSDAGLAVAAGRALAVAETGITKALEELSSHVATSRTQLKQELPPRPTVLVVDDDEFQSRLVGRILSSEHYLPEYASNGIDALAMIGKARPDLILMDIMMPDMSGLEVVTRLKADPELAKIPLIMMTGKREREVVLQCVKLGVSDFIGKPIDRKILLDKIGRLVAPGIAATDT